MRFWSAAITTALLIGWACPVEAQDVRGLAPNGGWLLDYADDSCALRRMFGEGNNQAYLEFRRFGPRLGLQTTVTSNRMRPKNPANFKYRFGELTDWRDAGIATLNMEQGFRGVLFNSSFVHLPEADELEGRLQEEEEFFQSIDTRAIETAAAPQANSITLRGAFSRDLTLLLGPLDKPITALNACVDELMSHWGIDLEAHKTLTRKAMPVNLNEVPSMMSYPPKMIRASMPGLVNIRLAIDETGRITGCHIQMPLSDPAFEESSCADIQHTLDFDPALDKDGKAIASYWITGVQFRLNDR